LGIPGRGSSRPSRLEERISTYKSVQKAGMFGKSTRKAMKRRE